MVIILFSPVVQSASTGLNRSHTVTPPYLYRHSPAAKCQTVVRVERVGATPALLRDTPWPPWTQLMRVCYGFSRWSYGGDTVDAGRATVMPRNKPQLFRSPVSHGCLKKMKPPGPLPAEHRFNTVYPDSMRCLPVPLRCGPGRPRCSHRSDAGTEIRDSANEAYLRLVFTYSVTVFGLKLKNYIGKILSSCVHQN